MFINNNHFNILIKKEYLDIFNIPEEIKNLEFNEFSKLISKKGEQNKSFIGEIKMNKLKKDNYVKFNKANLINYYKKIEEYILDNEKIPERLKTSLGKNKKKFSKKRGLFRKMVNNNYRIIDGRLQYKYTGGKDPKWLYISYESEIESILNYAHYNNNHLKKDRMSKHIIILGFFWFAYTEYIKEFINKCGICHCEEAIEKIPKKPKIIM